jgi:chitodextrinase
VFIQAGPDVVPPTQPGGLTAKARTDGSVRLTWSASTDDLAVTRYRVSRNSVEVGTTSTLAFVDNSPPQGATHTYAVVALDRGPNASTPAVVSVYVPDVTAPTKPGWLAVNLSGSRSVDLTWAATTDNVGVDHYRVSRNGIQIGTTSTTKLAGVTVADGFSHTFAVRAVDAAGNASAAAQTSVSVPDVTPPSGTTLFVKATGPTSVALSWGAASDNVAVTKYIISRDGAVIASLGGTATLHSDSGLSSGRSYAYSVVAVDAAGNAGPAANATATLTSADVIPPSKPLGLAGVPLGRRRVSLTWQASTDDRQGTLRYQVFRGRRKIATVTDTSYVDRPARVGRYKYRVRAVDAAGNKSSFSAAIWVRAKRRI